VRLDLPVNPRSLLTACVLIMLLTSPLASAQATESLPIAQRADAVGQVVLGILSYVRWPDEPSSLNLCIVGPTEYADSLLSEQGQANGRIVQAVRRAADDPALGDACHAVYLGAVTDAEQLQVFRTLSGHAVLTIGERNPDCSVGSAFCLHIQPQRVSFAVNLDSVARSGVRVHPSVLRLAQRKRQP
jgi:hypothetical protein